MGNMDFDLNVNYQLDRITSSFEEVQFAKKISSLVNSNGGKLVIGVNNNGKIVGVYPKDELENIPIVITHFCSSPIEFSSEVIEIKNKLLLVLNIHKSTKIAALTSENTFEYYFRIGETICIVNKIVQKLWSYEYETLTSCPGSTEELKMVHKNAHKQTLSQIYSNTNLTKSHVDSLVSWLLYSKQIRMTLVNNLVIYQHLD